ncbi:hypothetical protein Tco_0006427 [Tanacetum coccineum]
MFSKSRGEIHAINHEYMYFQQYAILINLAKYSSFAIRVISSSTHPIIVPSDSNVEDAFSSTTTPDYTPALPDYFPALPGNTPSDSSDDLTKMTPKRTSTSAALAMTQAAIRKLVADSVAVALEAQAATMENDDNTNRDT